MRSLRLAILLVVGLLTAAPVALAATAQGELEAGAVTLPRGGTLASAALDLRSAGGSAPTMDIDAMDVSIQRFGTTSVRSTAGVPVSYNLQQIDERATHHSARLTLATGEGEQLFALRTLGAATATLGETTMRGVGGALLARADIASTGGDVDAGPRCVDTACLDVFGVYAISGDALAQVSGEIVLLLYGPTLSVVADDGSRVEYASGPTSTQDAGAATQTEDAWILLRAGSASGSVQLTGGALYSAAPTLRAPQALFQDAEGAVRVGARDYRAQGDDVTAAGALVLTPGAVPAARDHGIDGDAVYASSITTRVAGDVQSIDLAGRIAFLDTPAEQAGAVALLLALAGAAAYAWNHLAFGAAALYTRLNKPDILENDVRNHIYDIIRQHPGISAREVHRQSSQSWGTVVYHLRQLERHHLVVSRALGRTRNYYENHGKYKGMEAQLACLQSERARVLARAIVAQPGITQEQLAVAAQFPQPTTSYYVRKLKQAGLVEEQRDGRYVKYVPVQDLPRFIELSESAVQTGATSTGVQA